MTTKQKSGDSKHDIVQVKNPRTDRYVKIDRSAGTIIAQVLIRCEGLIKQTVGELPY